MIDPQYTTQHNNTYYPMNDGDQGNRRSMDLAPALNLQAEKTHLMGEVCDDDHMDVVDDKDLTAENVPVNVISLYNLFLKYFPLIAKAAKSPEDALESLKSIKIPADNFGLVPLFTDFLDEKKKSVYSQLWVHIPERFAPKKQEFYLNFRIDQGPFYSQYLPDATSKESFNYLSIYEDEEPKPFIYLRLGNDGELLWLSKGSKLSGSSVKKICLMMLERIPLIPNGYLLDAAKISLRVKGRHSEKIEEVFLSMILALSSDNGESWYGRSGFSPLKCQNYQIKGDSISQDPDLYYQAVEKLREIRFNTLKVLFKRNHSRLKFLASCIKPDTNPTLHEVVKHVHGQTKLYPRSTPKAIEAETRLFQLYNSFINPNNLNMPSKSKELNLYFLALETLKSHVVWEKGFLSGSIQRSYERFKAFPHERFDQAMESVVLKRPFKWRLPDS